MIVLKDLVSKQFINNYGDTTQHFEYARTFESEAHARSWIASKTDYTDPRDQFVGIRTASEFKKKLIWKKDLEIVTVMITETERKPLEG